MIGKSKKLIPKACNSTIVYAYLPQARKQHATVQAAQQDDVRKWRVLPSVVPNKPAQTVVVESEATPSYNDSVVPSEFACTEKIIDKNPYFKMNFFNYPVEELWDVYWGRHLSMEKLSNLNPFQHVNHFPGSSNLGRKDSLHTNLLRMQQVYGEKEYDFFPKSYLLPHDWSLFNQEQVQPNPSKVLISKPFASSCGRGIHLVTANDPILQSKHAIVSEYIDPPFLINEYKFDLRLYVLVTSYKPLRVYLFHDGLVRFATKPYTMDNIDSRFTHLTNYSLNKHSKDFVRNADSEQDNVGNKWSLQALKRELNNMPEVNQEKLWTDIEDVIIKTLVSVEEKIVTRMEQANMQRNSCFELYGFDIMIDKALKPWLIEVNILPSLAAASPLDRKIKQQVVSQMFHLLGTVSHDRSDLPKAQRQYLDYHHGKPDATEQYIVDDLLDEHNRRGNYERIFPKPNNANKFDHLFCKQTQNVNHVQSAFVTRQ